MIHALVATLAYGETRRRVLTRRRPGCGHEQLTTEGKLSEPVPCDGCAAPIPPERASGQSMEQGDERRTATRGGG